jgi:hypothetical protein
VLAAKSLDVPGNVAVNGIINVHKTGNYSVCICISGREVGACPSLVISENGLAA